MTTPAATAALARALCVDLGDPYERHVACAACGSVVAPEGATDAAARILAHDFTPAERAALIAAIATPEVLAEALHACLMCRYDGPDADECVCDTDAAAILTALAARGAEPDVCGHGVPVGLACRKCKEATA